MASDVSMNRQEIVVKVAEVTDMSATVVEAVLTEIIKAVTKELSQEVAGEPQGRLTHSNSAMLW